MAKNINVYVADDAATPISNVVTGELIAVTVGSTTAAAIAHELRDEDDEIALERYQEISAAPTGE
jgi:translation initiation factor 2 gamma subunit (eIF-2gamma)